MRVFLLILGFAYTTSFVVPSCSPKNKNKSDPAAEPSPVTSTYVDSKENATDVAVNIVLRTVSIPVPPESTVVAQGTISFENTGDLSLDGLSRVTINSEEDPRIYDHYGILLSGTDENGLPFEVYLEEVDLEVTPGDSGFDISFVIPTTILQDIVNFKVIVSPVPITPPESYQSPGYYELELRNPRNALYEKIQTSYAITWLAPDPNTSLTPSHYLVTFKDLNLDPELPDDCNGGDIAAIPVTGNSHTFTQMDGKDPSFIICSADDEGTSTGVIATEKGIVNSCNNYLHNSDSQSFGLVCSVLEDSELTTTTLAPGATPTTMGGGSTTTTLGGATTTTMGGGSTTTTSGGATTTTMGGGSTTTM